jgi:plastocyanin
MIQSFVVTRRKLWISGITLIVLIAAWAFWNREDILPADGPAGGKKTFHMVTGEFKSTLPDGTEIEAYRWDPGTILVEKGDTVTLKIRGINGASHPFIIEGLNVKGEVKKGQETVVTFEAAKEGTYRIICLTHPDASQNGPMIGYIIVD